MALLTTDSRALFKPDTHSQLQGENYKSIIAATSGAIGFGCELIEMTKKRGSETRSDNAPPWNP